MVRTLTLLFILIQSISWANDRSSEIYVDLQKLASLNKVLYIAAHPDDENTRLLAYLSLGEKAETAYMSLTRGDGGQNLIGDELGAELGVLRTQELLAARSYDGANQFFSRAVDFGYSKSADESLDKWGKDEVLSDVVRIIRQFKPDIIITRFPPDKRGGHGHHTASAMLAIEAFDKAADPNFEPETAKEYGAWETTSLYWNTSYWWMKSIADSAKKYPDRYFSKDIGGYNSLLGMSYNEIGSIARSQHKCQGFGAFKEKGPRIEYFEHLAGKTIEHSFFEDVDRSWSSIMGKQFEKDMNALIADFDFVYPERNVPQLISLRNRLLKSKNRAQLKDKAVLCNKLIINCLGLSIEVVSDDYSFVNDDSVSLSLNVVNRSDLELKMKTVSINDYKEKLNVVLGENEMLEHPINTTFNASITTPYWLKEPYGDMFVVKDEKLIGKAENDPTLSAKVQFELLGNSCEVNVPVEYKWRDPSFGERRRELISAPAFTANFEKDMILSKEKEERSFRIKIHSFKDNLQDKIKLIAPEGWELSKAEFSLAGMNKHEERWIDVVIETDRKALSGQLKLVNGKGEVVNTYQEIEYDHIPTQTLISKAEIPCVVIDAEIEEGKIAYINGVEDAVPQAIEQLGYQVDQFEVSELSNIDLSAYLTVVLGIRIYNVHPELFNYHEQLFEYVDNGGNLVMQYNTASRSIRDEEFGPAPFKLSRDRVTEEDAEVVILDEEHPIFTYPNKITIEDFKGWVQERGLYFAGEWSEEYKPLIAWHDKGEEDVKGGLLVMEYGKGRFIYTGISFFRELPKGVVGAYRLFANIISYDPKAK